MVFIILLGLFVGRYWYDTAAPGQTELGVSFSCRQARYLGEDCLTVYRSLLDDLGVRHVRLSLFWSEVEHSPGHYDFGETDALVREAGTRGVDVLLTLGIKAQRYPEIYLPAWLGSDARAPDGTTLDRLPGVRDAVLRFDAAAVTHYRDDPAVIGWQVENEPFIKNFEKIHGWRVSPEMTAAEVDLVRAQDSRHRPVVVTHSSWTIYDQAWKQALALGDVLGQNVFTKKAWITDWWYFFPYEMGSFVPNLPGQTAKARRGGKVLWITELQAEPEERHALTELRPDDVRSISPDLMRQNVLLARRARAERAYLWGAEWWYTTRGQGPAHDMWQAAGTLFAELRVGPK